MRLIVSVGAGVDSLLDDATLPDLPLVRFVDPDLTGRMAEYIALNVLTHHRRMTEYRELQARREWKYLPEAPARDVRVGIMGLGVLGAAAARALAPFGYQLSGWSRTPKALDGVACFAGLDALDPFLAETDILAVLLPLTPATRGILNRALFAKLSLRGRNPLLPGPVLINAGRGGLQRDADILAALEAGELYAASLDVFEQEPLPADSALWAHPRRRHHAAQCGRERAGGDRRLRASPDARAPQRRAPREPGGPRPRLLKPTFARCCDCPAATRARSFDCQAAQQVDGFR